MAEAFSNLGKLNNGDRILVLKAAKEHGVRVTPRYSLREEPSRGNYVPSIILNPEVAAEEAVEAERFLVGCMDRRCGKNLLARLGLNLAERAAAYFNGGGGVQVRRERQTGVATAAAELHRVRPNQLITLAAHTDGCGLVAAHADPIIKMKLDDNRVRERNYMRMKQKQTAAEAIKLGAKPGNLRLVLAHPTRDGGLDIEDIT